MDDEGFHELKAGQSTSQKSGKTYKDSRLELNGDY